MINIAVFIPNNPLDGISFYRALGPLTLLKKQWPEMNFYQYTNMNWNVAFESDLLFMTKPTSRESMSIVQYAKEHGLPVWLDYDDDYLNPTDDAPRKGTPLEQLVKETVSACLKLADRVTVTNEHLKSVYAPVCGAEKIVVIPNAFDDRLKGLMNSEINPRNVIFWRGNETQARDIEHFANQIREIFTENREYNWAFMNYDPYTITDFFAEKDFKRLNYFPGMELMEYFRKLCSVNWAVVIKPLVDNTFNRSRSNITWIEATLAGSVCLAPAFESWTDYSDKDGLLTYSDRTDFKKKLKWILKNPQEIKRLVESSRNYIEKNLLLSKINERRKQLIFSILEEAHGQKSGVRDFTRTERREHRDAGGNPGTPQAQAEKSGIGPAESTH